MITLKQNSTQAQHFINRYMFNNKGSSLFDIYKKPSSEKIRSFERIKKFMDEVGGYSLHITGGNTDVYMCGFLANENDITYLYYFTKDNTYKIEY